MRNAENGTVDVGCVSKATLAIGTIAQSHKEGKFCIVYMCVCVCARTIVISGTGFALSVSLCGRIKDRGGIFVFLFFFLFFIIFFLSFFLFFFLSFFLSLLSLLSLILSFFFDSFILSF